MADVFKSIKTEDYPEHEKLHKVKDQSQSIGDFISWLRDTQEINLCVQHEHTDDCYSAVDGGGRSPMCGMRQHEFLFAGRSITTLLAEFFEIDEDKLEQEKQAMLALVRKVR